MTSGGAEDGGISAKGGRRKAEGGGGRRGRKDLKCTSKHDTCGLVMRQGEQQGNFQKNSQDD